jgi:hypothetical protein
MLGAPRPVGHGPLEQAEIHELVAEATREPLEERCVPDPVRRP